MQSQFEQADRYLAAIVSRARSRRRGGVLSAERCARPTRPRCASTRPTEKRRRYQLQRDRDELSPRPPRRARRCCARSGVRDGRRLGGLDGSRSCRSCAVLASTGRTMSPSTPMTSPSSRAPRWPRRCQRFRYASRLSTWTYGVVVQSAKRYVRDQSRLKRAVRPDSLDQLDLPDPAASQPTSSPMPSSRCVELIALIADVLAAQPMTSASLQSFCSGRSTTWRAEEIGRRVGLSQSRVRTCCSSTICRTLQESPEHPGLARRFQ